MASELVVVEVVVEVETEVVVANSCKQSRATVGNVVNIVTKTPSQ